MRILITLFIIWLSLLRVTNGESAEAAVPEKSNPDNDTTTDAATADSPPNVDVDEQKLPSHDNNDTELEDMDTMKEKSEQEQVETDPLDEGTVQNPASHHPGSGKQRLWGSPTQYEDDEPHRAIPKEEEALKDEHHHNVHIHHPPPHKADKHDVKEEHETPPTHHHNLHIPFVPKSTHPPPPGYLISARVYIDPKDKLGHIDEDVLTLPYWDCGAVGSTTSPLKVTDVAFRHSLTPSQGWTGTDGKHPVLAIALSEFILEVSSGATKVIQPGEAVLLEDVLIDGHKMRPVSNHHPVRVMFLTLPKTHYSTGKDKISIPSPYRNSNDPCPIPDGTSSNTALQRVSRDGRILRVALGVAGLSLSTIVADFLGKTAPLWLAVGVGGLFFVAAGTVGTVVLGETAANSFQAWRFQRRLKSDTMPSEEDRMTR